MSPEVRLNTDAAVYELGFEVDGVFIVLQTVQTSYVTAHVENVKAAEAAQPQPQPQQTTPPPPQY